MCWQKIFEFFYIFAVHFYQARMAKSVDALVSGTSGRKAVQVRVLFRALKKASQTCDAFFSAVLGTPSYWGTPPDPRVLSTGGRSLLFSALLGIPIPRVLCEGRESFKILDEFLHQ